MSTRSASHTKTAKSETRRVAIVEDESLVAMLLEDIFADLGHEVVGIAGTISRATELVSDADIDFALLDVNLNGDKTYAIADLLRRRGIPFAFATGYGEANLPKEWGDVPVLEKPFEPRDLERAMNEALSGG